VSVDFIFFGLTATCIFVFRRLKKGRASESVVVSAPDLRATARAARERISTVPGHPLTTALFIVVCWLVVINTVYRYPENTLIGLGLLLAGIPVFYFWRGRDKK
jgi:APA family basic amino acid/polyamine antiporter